MVINTAEEKSGMKNIVLWRMMRYSPVEVHRYFILLTPSSILVSSMVYRLRLKKKHWLVRDVCFYIRRDATVVRTVRTTNPTQKCGRLQNNVSSVHTRVLF